MHGRQFPPDHPYRKILNDEVHARPPEELVAPTRLSFLALTLDAGERKRNFDLICDLARDRGVTAPDAGSNHYSQDMGNFRLKWEQHTEFMRFKFIVRGADGPSFADPALRQVPGNWLSALEGKVLVATHVLFMPGAEAPLHYDQISQDLFEGNPLVGSAVGSGAGRAFTDFRIRPDGFGRLYLEDHGLTRRQAGRTVQRLLEIDVYRMLALLTFPLAKEMAPEVGGEEQRLAEITTALAGTKDDIDEPALLDSLTKLQAEITSRRADNDYHFSASEAYYEIVQGRIRELREERIAGLQTFNEFVSRRLTPAMNTCETIAKRQAELSEKVAQATALLSTRVDIARQTQNQRLLESMDKRAKMQLRLQQTVEGLSVAAISYYLVSLVGYGAKGLETSGMPLNADVVMALSIPLVALGVWAIVRRARRAMTRSARADEAL